MWKNSLINTKKLIRIQFIVLLHISNLDICNHYNTILFSTFSSMVKN